MSTRADRRTANDLRPLAINQSVLERADGSAKFSFGNVTTLASITGPSEVRIRDELVDRATLEINVKPLRGSSGPSSKSTEKLLQSLFSPIILLNLHPRSLIQISIQTISSPSTSFSQAFSIDPSDLPPTFFIDTNDNEQMNVVGKNKEAAGGKGKKVSKTIEGLGVGTAERACVINSIMLALIDSGIECKGLILAVAIAFIPLPRSGKNNENENESEVEDETEMILDPTPLEELKSKSTHLFSFSFGMSQNTGGIEGVCVGIDSLGKFTEDELFDAQDLAANAVRGINVFVRKSIETRYLGAEPLKKKLKLSKNDMDVEE